MHPSSMKIKQDVSKHLFLFLMHKTDYFIEDENQLKKFSYMDEMFK